MMSSQAGKMVTVGSIHGQPTDVEISSRAQALCQFLRDLPSGSALPDVRIASLRIVLAYLDGDEALTGLMTSTHDTALLLLFAQTWALAARLGLPTVQNKLTSAMQDVYDVSLDDHTVYPADEFLLKAFSHLVQEAGKDSHAESFLICFVARTTPTTSELEKQLNANGFAENIRGSLLAEARSFDRDPIEQTPQRFRVDTSHPPSYQPLDARSAYVPVFVSRRTPVSAMHDKQSCRPFQPADSHLSCQTFLLPPAMSPPPTYDNMFNYSAVLPHMKDVPVSHGDSAFPWTFPAGRDPLHPPVPTMTDHFAMPIQDVPSGPPLIRIADAAATAAQNRGLGLDNGAQTTASTAAAAPPMAPSVPTPDEGPPRMPQIAQGARNNSQNATAMEAGPANNAFVQIAPTLPPLAPATSPAVRPVDTVPIRQPVGSIDDIEAGARPLSVPAPMAPKSSSPAPVSIPIVQPVDAAPTQQPGMSPDESKAVSRPKTDTHAPQKILHCCEFRPVKQRNWVSRILHGWRCPGVPCPQHECENHPLAINQTTRSAGATSCGRHHWRLPAEGIIVSTHAQRSQASHHQHSSPSPEPRRGDVNEPSKNSPRRGRTRHTPRNDTLAIRTPDHDIHVPRSTRPTRRGECGHRGERTHRGSRRHTSQSSSDETIAWWRPKKTGEKTKFNLVSYERHRWDE
ncbi:hypothetical protein HBI70_181390 [Parastagonospora nodorum]|nr:hypothetical protein HBH51_168490 [Parastagonospora nodorum]KAH4015587.1 hypothetical protein HBI09_206220 [Parastagonospora nodorum]KAH4845811.1 hypothetical protein HBH75_176690 [Parastagonospora nodorum]KAH4978924.1 hypothetical protein HBI77_224430 [Parastagonospora nodorum]KAH5067506.1 hypothetical protein HBH95_196380 [Parastagonospora nodorum]